MTSHHSNPSDEMCLSGQMTTLDQLTLDSFLHEKPSVCERLTMAPKTLGDHASEETYIKEEEVTNQKGIDALEKYMEAVTDDTLLQNARAEQSARNWQDQKA